MKFKNISAFYLLIIIILLFNSCKTNDNDNIKKNVLFIVIDDYRPEIHSLTNSKIITPNIDRLSNEGVYFNRAYCQWPVCGPSRASFMTGLRPENTKVFDNGTSVDYTIPDHISLPGYFKKNGFYTASIGKIYHKAKHDQKSWDFNERGNWQNYGNPENYKITEPGLPLFEKENLPDEMYTDGKTTETALELLNKLKDSTFFMAVGFYKPHMPFAAPKKYWDLYDPNEISISEYPNAPEGIEPFVYLWTELWKYREFYWIDTITDYRKAYISDDDARKIIHGYYACVSFIDAQIGKLLNKLDELNLSQNTVVCLISDHGWHLGDQSIWGKHTLYERSARVPLIIRLPGIKTKVKKTDAIVELVDIYPTLADLCGLPVPDKTDGISLKPILYGENINNAEAITQYSPFIPTYSYCFGTSIVNENYRYTLWQNKFDDYGVVSKEFYDYSEIRDETENKADRQEFLEIQERLHQKLITKTNLSQKSEKPISDQESISLLTHSFASASYNSLTDKIRILYTTDLKKMVVLNDSTDFSKEFILNDNGGMILNCQNWFPGEYIVEFYEEGQLEPIISEIVAVGKIIDD